MATADPVELPSGVRHGTPEGHLAGCKGERANCPALAEHGMSCTYAYVRSTTTPDRYYKAKARNPEPREIARTLGFRPTTPEQVLAEVSAADAALHKPRPRKPTPPRERTAPMPEPTIEPTPTVDEQPAPTPVDDAPADAAAPTEYSSADVRRWAQETGTTVPAHGPIPKAVTIAYELAHGIEHRAPAQTPKSTPDKPEHLTLADFTRGLTQIASRERGREIRTWLRHRGNDISDKGVVPSEMLHRYLAAHPGALTPAQPLAERSQDPSDTIPTPVDEVAAATPPEAPAEGEDMGHPEPAPLEHTEATAELIDQVRDRIDMPHPESVVADFSTIIERIRENTITVDEAYARSGLGTRPEWADVAISEDVNRANAERDAAIAERDRARSLAIALDHAHDAAIARAETAEHALELALRSWHQATINFESLTRLHQRVQRAALGWQRRAHQSETALNEIRAAAQRGPGAVIAAIIAADGRALGVRIIPPQTRRTWWRKNAR